MKSIRTKLILSVVVLFTLVGLLIYLPLSRILPEKITSQVLSRDIEIAKHISHEAKDLVLLDDTVSLSLLLHDNLERLQDAEYLFVKDSPGNVISHTFPDGFPRALMDSGVGEGSEQAVKKFFANGRKVYDISIPMLGGEIGTFHLGVSMESEKKEIAGITKISYYVAAVIAGGLAIGISMFLTIGVHFSKQVSKLNVFCERVAAGDLDGKIDIKSGDEIGGLASGLNRMALGLKEKIKEIKRLNTIEERNRIALDLHDSCAQDLALVIKRLELCEKLFRTNSEKGYEELDLLKENTRDILNTTRQVILDLKSVEDKDFNLERSLRSYISNYQNLNDIKVRLNISGEIGNIPPEKSRSLFYIVVEALSNVRRHSLAKNVEVFLVTDGELAIKIQDDGKGFNVEETLPLARSQGKCGLFSMRERANSLGGSCTIDSSGDGGTKISVNVPL